MSYIIRYLHLFVIMEDTYLPILSAFYMWQPNFRALYGRSCLEPHFSLPCHSHMSICSPTLQRSTFPVCMSNVKRSSFLVITVTLVSIHSVVSLYICVYTHTHTHTHVYIWIYTHVCVHLNTYLYTYTPHTHMILFTTRLKQPLMAMANFSGIFKPK